MSQRPRELPPRYRDPWREPFARAALARMGPGASVLDVGSGRRPAFPPEERPEGLEYVGLDISAAELGAAGPGAYTQTVAADAGEMREELAGRFDVVVSWQVLEHVRDLPAAVENVRHYLRPGGELVALFSGSWSAFGVINRLLPDELGSRIVDRVMRRSERNLPVFPAYYDHCHARAVRRMFGLWSELELTPLYRGAAYFAFAPPLMRAYLAYEDLVAERRVEDLATHYLIRAVR